MPDYVFNLEALPPGEYKATIVILADGRKEIAVVTKTQPDAKIPLIQVPFVISHRPLYELLPHGNLIDRDALMEIGSDLWVVYDDDNGVDEAFGFSNDVILNAPVIVPASEEAQDD